MITTPPTLADLEARQVRGETVDPDLWDFARMREDCRIRRAAEVRIARYLERAVRRGMLQRFGCSTVAQLGEHVGLSGWDARRYLDLGRALEVDSSLAASYRRGEFALEAAAGLSRVLCDERMRRPEDRWREWACRLDTQSFVARVRQRREEILFGPDPVTVRRLAARTTTFQKFDRARLLMSRQASVRLSEGETLDRLVEEWLEESDFMRVEPGARRMPDTEIYDVPGRSIPAEVRREIEERSQAGCEIPFCDLRVCDLAHHVPHVQGGSRESKNVYNICKPHHRWFDIGSVIAIGTPEAPRFVNSFGWELGVRWVLPPETAPPNDG